MSLNKQNLYLFLPLYAQKSYYESADADNAHTLNLRGGVFPTALKH